MISQTISVRIFLTLTRACVIFIQITVTSLLGESVRVLIYILIQKVPAHGTLFCSEKKKWALFPPGTSPEYLKNIGSRTCQSGTAPGGPVSYWWLDIAPHVGKDIGMIECVQLPGETIFIPAGWWHCVVNLEFSMAITQNLLIPKSLPTTWHQIKKDWPKFSNYVESTTPEALKEVDGLVLNSSGPKTSLPIEEDEDALLEFHLTQMQ